MPPLYYNLLIHGLTAQSGLSQLQSSCLCWHNMNMLPSTNRPGVIKTHPLVFFSEEMRKQAIKVFENNPGFRCENH